jgi:hypothetical protein
MARALAAPTVGTGTAHHVGRNSTLTARRWAAARRVERPGGSLCRPATWQPGRQTVAPASRQVREVPQDRAGCVAPRLRCPLPYLLYAGPLPQVRCWQGRPCPSGEHVAPGPGRRNCPRVANFPGAGAVGIPLFRKSVQIEAGAVAARPAGCGAQQVLRRWAERRGGRASSGAPAAVWTASTTARRWARHLGAPTHKPLTRLRG